MLACSLTQAARNAVEGLQAALPTTPAHVEGSQNSRNISGRIDVDAWISEQRRSLQSIRGVMLAGPVHSESLARDTINTPRQNPAPRAYSLNPLAARFIPHNSLHANSSTAHDATSSEAERSASTSFTFGTRSASSSVDTDMSRAAGCKTDHQCTDTESDS